MGIDNRIRASGFRIGTTWIWAGVIPAERMRNFRKRIWSTRHRTWPTGIRTGIGRI
jgi:hypothetical protein